MVPNSCSSEIGTSLSSTDTPATLYHPGSSVKTPAQRLDEPPAAISSRMNRRERGHLEHRLVDLEAAATMIEPQDRPGVAARPPPGRHDRQSEFRQFG